MNLSLHDKKALVIAASKGIGKGAALALAREGCQVIITSSNAEHLSKAGAEIKAETGSEVSHYIMDVTSRSSVEAVSDRILSEHERIDILITNGPGPKPTDAATVEIDGLIAALNTNLVNMVLLCEKFLPRMIENGFGRIISLSSSTGKEPDEGMVLSNVARAGLLAYAKTLSREVGKHGITINTILTGSVMTERAVNLLEADAKSLNVSYDEIVKQASESIPAGYISTPEQFCHTIAFLASPLSMYVNGVSLPIDGGYMRGV